MAFTTPLTITTEGYSKTYAEAYIKATVRLCTATNTVVQLQVWESQAERIAGAPPIRYDYDLRTFATELELQANNPIDYAYQLLQAGDEFTNATWNV